MVNITKFIPYNIRVKSLYWVRREKEIEIDLTNLFSKIDNDEYEEAWLLLEELKTKWIPIKCPEWFLLEYIPQFSKAEAMLNFLAAKSE